MASPHDQREKALAEPFLCSSVRFLCFWLSSLGSDVINFGIAGDQEICSKKFTGLSVSFSFSTSVLLGDILRRSLSCSLSHRRESRETAAAKSLQKKVGYTVQILPSSKLLLACENLSFVLIVFTYAQISN